MIAQYIKYYSLFKMECFVCDKNFIKDNVLSGYPVIDFDIACKEYPNTEYSYINTIGYSKMNDNRKNIAERITQAGYEIENLIFPNSNVYTEDIGHGNIILDGVNIGFNSTVGDGNIFWSGSNLSHEINIGNFNYFSPNCAIAGNVNVGNNCFFGINSTVINGINVKDYTLVGAGSTIKNDTKEKSVYSNTATILCDKKSTEVVID